MDNLEKTLKEVSSSLLKNIDNLIKYGIYADIRVREGKNIVANVEKLVANKEDPYQIIIKNYEHTLDTARLYLHEYLVPLYTTCSECSEKDISEIGKKGLNFLNKLGEKHDAYVKKTNGFWYKLGKILSA